MAFRLLTEVWPKNLGSRGHLILLVGQTSHHFCCKVGPWRLAFIEPTLSSPESHLCLLIFCFTGFGLHLPL